MPVKYSSRELRVLYFNGAGYVVREDTRSYVTPHGVVAATVRTVHVGARQGGDPGGGFRTWRYRRGQRAS